MVKGCAGFLRNGEQYLPSHKKEYDELMLACHAADIAREKRDTCVLSRVDSIVSAELYTNIKFELEQSRHTNNYRITSEPIGMPQHEEGGEYTLFVDQHCGVCGDDFYGTCCIELPDGTYFMWDYWD